MKPVSESGAPGYHSIIKNPVDFTILKKRIDASDYSNFLQLQVVDAFY